MHMPYFQLIKLLPTNPKTRSFGNVILNQNSLVRRMLNAKLNFYNCLYRMRIMVRCWKFRLVTRDRLVWPFAKKGIFSVKSRFHWAVSRTPTRGSPSPSSSTSIPSSLWKVIWNLQTTPKIWCFMWKSFHSAIATMENLFKKRSAQSPVCPLCNIHEESVEHLFILCPWVKLVWFGSALNLKINQDQISTWADWLIDISRIARGSKSKVNWKLSYIGFTCWQIWKVICNALFNQVPGNPWQVVISISNMAGAFTKASTHCSTPLSSVTQPLMWYYGLCLVWSS